MIFLILISSSGNSKNVLEGVKARKKNLIELLL